MTNENPLKLYARAGSLHQAYNKNYCLEVDHPRIRDDKPVRLVDKSTPTNPSIKFSADGYLVQVGIDIAKTLDSIEHGELISPPELTLLYQYIVDRNLFRFLVSNQYATGKELIGVGLVDYSRLGCLA